MKHLGLFAAGVLFGTAGLKILSSKDAKKVYSHTTAAVLRAKDCVMQAVTNVREDAEDVYADAKADTVKEFLGVLDNLERGLAQFAEGDPHRQGMELICRQFLAVLEKLGVTRIEAQGQPFDPQKHDAVMHVEDENVGENTVVEVLQQGYQLGDKVLRFAMVKVAN